MGVLDTHFGGPLAHALWSTQRGATEASGTRTSWSGGISQRLLCMMQHPHTQILGKMTVAHRHWSSQLLLAKDEQAHLDLKDKMDSWRSASMNSKWGIPAARNNPGRPDLRWLGLVQVKFKRMEVLRTDRICIETAKTPTACRVVRAIRSDRN